MLAHDRSPDRVNVCEMMSKRVPAVDPAMEIRYCAGLFKKLGLSFAPGACVGTTVIAPQSSRD